MPWSAPSLLGAPPAYAGAWQPSLCPHTGVPRLLTPRQPANAYHATPSYGPYGAPSPSPADGSLYYMPSSALLPSSAYQPALLLTPTSPAPPSWDQVTFLHDMNNFGAQGNLGTNWIFYSGASSHMFASSNLLSSCTPSLFLPLLLVMVHLFPYTVFVRLKFPLQLNHFFFEMFLLHPPLLKT